MILPNKDTTQYAFKSALDSWVASQRAKATSGELADMYHTSVWAYSAANFWASNVSAVEFKLYRSDDDTPIENPSAEDDIYPLWNMLQSHTFADMMRKTEITMRFWGYSVSRKERNVYDVARSLTWVNPFLYTRDADSINGLKGFYIYPGRYQPNPTEYLAVGDAVYFHETLDFQNDLDGVSSAEVAFLQASASTEIAQTQLASFRNLAIPAAIAQPAADSMTPQEDEANALTNWLTRFFKGARNAARTLVTPTRWEWIQLTAAWKDQIPTEQENQLRETIAAAFELPIEFITTGQTNYAELEGKIALWRQMRLVPRLIWYGHRLTDQLCNEYAGVYIAPDYSQTLASEEKARIELVDTKRDKAYISLGEAQSELGIDAPQEFMNLYWYEGIGYVPRDEFANIWRYKIGQAIQAPVTTASDVTVEEPTPSLLSADNATESDMDAIVDAIAGDNEPHLFLPDDVYKEIEIATRKSLKSSPFAPEKLPVNTVAYIRHLADAGMERDSIIGSAKAHYIGIKAAAAIRPIRAAFERQLDRLFKNAVRGQLNQSSFEQILLSEVNNAIEGAAYAGLRDGGVRTEALTDDERAYVDDWKAAQVLFVANVTAAIYEDDAVTPDEAEGKAQLWWNKSVNPVYAEMIARASRNAAFKRVLGATEQHCVDCAKIDGQVRRASFWKSVGIWNASEKTQCGGWRCECRNIQTDEAVTRGRFPKIVGPVQ